MQRIYIFSLNAFRYAERKTMEKILHNMRYAPQLLMCRGTRLNTFIR